MSDAVALLATVANPYSHGRMDSAWEALDADVPTVHRDAFDRCVALAEDVARDHQSHGAVLSGQPGAGKTHALARLQRHVVERERGWFVYVRPMTGPDRFFRHLLHALTGDVLRPPHGRVTVSQLEVALARHLMAQVDAPAHSVNGWWETARARYPSPEDLLDFLRTAVAPITDALQLDEHVSRVVVHLGARLHRPQARAWLMGRAITEDDCARLGVAGSLDDEAAAEEAVATLLSLAGPGFPVVLAFDQIEGLQRTREDKAGLMAFAHGVDRVFSRARNVAALTCAQVAFVDDLRQAVGRALFTGRLAERGEFSLAPLNTVEALALARQRAATSTSVQQVRLLQQWRHPAAPGVADPLWPLLASEVEVLAVQSPTPREIIFACREKFEERRLAGGATGAPTIPPTPVESFETVWASAVDREERTPVDLIDEGVYGDGLIRAIDAIAPPGIAAEISTIKDIDVLIRAPGGRVGVSVCHAEHMTSLAARLRRLTSELGRGNVDRLCVLRDARLPIKPTARATNAYLEQLQQGGATYSRPPAEAYVALAAIRNLLAEAAAGDLTLDGRTVAPILLKDWLARNAPSAVADLIEEITGTPATSATNVTRERVLAVIVRAKVAEIGAVAAEAQVSPDAIRELLARPDVGVGLIEGTPPVLFLHPDVVEKA